MAAGCSSVVAPKYKDNPEPIQNQSWEARRPSAPTLRCTSVASEAPSRTVEYRGTVTLLKPPKSSTQNSSGK